MKRILYGMSLVAIVVMMSIVCSCGNSGKKQGEVTEDSLAVSTKTKETPSDPFVGKTYKGSGSLGGIGIDITISFQENHCCLCESDWYRTYSSPKTIKGTYEVKNNLVIVNCKDNKDEYRFELEVHSNGRVLGYNNSDPEMGGTMGQIYMWLELQGEETYSKQDIQSMKAFLEAFYDKMGIWGEIDETIIDKNVTAKARKILKEKGNEYLSFGEEAYGQVASMKITHIDDNCFEVCITYLEEQTIYTKYIVKISVVKDRGSYKIDTIEKGKM